MYGSNTLQPTTLESDRCYGRITDLLIRCGQGEEVALGRLFDVFYRLVRAAVGPQGSLEAAEDRVVQVFVHLWLAAPSYDRAEQPAVTWVMHQVSTFLLASERDRVVAVPA